MEPAKVVIICGKLEYHFISNATHTQTHTLLTQTVETNCFFLSFFHELLNPDPEYIANKL